MVRKIFVQEGLIIKDEKMKNKIRKNYNIYMDLNINTRFVYYIMLYYLYENKLRIVFKLRTLHSMILFQKHFIKVSF